MVVVLAVLTGFRRPGASDGLAPGGSKHAAKRAPQPLPEGYCISTRLPLWCRGTPGITSRSQPTVWAR
jgi:hypothetical protein